MTKPLASALLGLGAGIALLLPAFVLPAFAPRSFVWSPPSGRAPAAERRGSPVGRDDLGIGSPATGAADGAPASRAWGISVALVRDGEIVPLPYVPLERGTERVVLDVSMDPERPASAANPIRFKTF